MFIERVTLSNFRCFGPTPETISLDPAVTAFVGTNGAGKTALMQALLRLFGVTYEQRRLRRQDFHVPLGDLSRRIGQIFASSELAEKRAILSYLIQNPTVSRKNLEFTLRKPFNTVLELAHRPDLLLG